MDQAADGLPDLHGPLSARIPAATIAAANDAVRDAIAEDARKSRGNYVIYTPTVRLEIAKYMPVTMGSHQQPISVDRHTTPSISLAAPPLRIILEGSGVSRQLYQSQGFLRSNQIADTHGRINYEYS